LSEAPEKNLMKISRSRIKFSQVSSTTVRILDLSDQVTMGAWKMNLKFYQSTPAKTQRDGVEALNG
jgi:hypothetical protein